MTWIKFILWLSGIYTLYYAAILLLDSLRGNNKRESENSTVIRFAEQFQPQKMEPGLLSAAITSPILSSGGISLKQLFNEAQEDSIEYTRKVSF